LLGADEKTIQNLGYQAAGIAAGDLNPAGRDLSL
jgi:hypothetical protein